MSAPTEIMSRKRSVARPANVVVVWFKIFSAKLYVALDKTQRKRAAEIIQQYAHLISEENSGEQKKAFLSREPDYESRQFWPARNRERRGSKT
jgi:hypothetical protein